MLRKPLRLMFGVGLLVGLLCTSSNASANTPASTHSQLGTDLTLVIKSTKRQRNQAVKSWSREARMAAKPVKFATDLPFKGTNGGAGVSGEPGSSPAGKPNPQAVQRAMRQFAADWQVSESDSAIQGINAPEGTPKVFTGYPVNVFSQMRTDFPFAAIGKLYFDGAYCTASVISPNNIIVTAAHCVYDTTTNQWLSGWVFVPADTDGAAPFGTFPWVSVRILKAWRLANAPVTQYDIALITLDNNSNGDSISSLIGWLGRSWDYNYVQELHAFGYPSNIDSRFSYLCAAESFTGGADVLGMGCNMTFGSSGGPWLRMFAPYLAGNRNSVDSVVSGGTPGLKTFYGARFTSNNIVPLCNAEGC